MLLNFNCVLLARMDFDSTMVAIYGISFVCVCARTCVWWPPCACIIAQTHDTQESRVRTIYVTETHYYVQCYYVAKLHINTHIHIFHL